ncbi:hypothetical protein EfmAA290_19910 [Enterococcus faecium]|nr:hypothetical protein EfmAA290_19910 [Enterococcus faecium]
MVYYEDEKLKGISGTLSPTINKGICAICQKTSNVSLFLSTTKAGSDGTYTKKGNYICHDSDQCNQQLTKLAPFYEFAERVKKEIVKEPFTKTKRLRIVFNDSAFLLISNVLARAINYADKILLYPLLGGTMVSVDEEFLVFSKVVSLAIT